MYFQEKLHNFPLSSSSYVQRPTSISSKIDFVMGKVPGDNFFLIYVQMTEKLHKFVIYRVYADLSRKCNKNKHVTKRKYETFWTFLRNTYSLTSEKTGVSPESRAYHDLHSRRKRTSSNSYWMNFIGERQGRKVAPRN